MPSNTMKALQTGRDGLPVFTSLFDQDSMDIHSESPVPAFKIDQLRVHSPVGEVKLPEGSITVRISVAVFHPVKKGDRDSLSELFRTSKICTLRYTPDRKVEVYFDEGDDAFVIPAVTLYVKQRSGNSITFGLPETTFTQIWFETIDWQETWPILGLNHSFNNFVSDELEEEDKNDALLMAKFNSLLHCTRHSVPLKIRLNQKSCHTSLCLEFKVEHLSSNPARHMSEKSPEKKKSYELEENPGDSKTASIAVEERTPVVEAKAEISRSNKRKRDQVPEIEEAPKRKESASNLEIEPSDVELSEDRLEAERDGEEDEDVRRGRRSRNQNPVYNPKKHFRQLMNGLPTESSSSQYITRQSSHQLDALNQERRYGPGGFGGGENFLYADGTEIPSNKKRNGKSPQKQAAKKQQKTLVPKSRRPLYSITNRRMLEVGDELHASDDNPDDDWEMQRNIYTINDFTDVTDEEKEFMIKWNGWVAKPRNDCSCGTFFQENLIRFCAENQAWFLEKRSRHLEMLKFWKCANDRVREVNVETWIECSKFLEPESGLWKSGSL